MRTEPQRNLVVRVAADVERIGVGAELVLVAVGRRVQEERGVARRDRHAAYLGVAGGGAHEGDDRGGPPEHFLGRGVEQRTITGQAPPLVGPLGERRDAARDRVPGGLVAGDQQLVEEHHELVVAE